MGCQTMNICFGAHSAGLNGRDPRVGKLVLVIDRCLRGLDCNPIRSLLVFTKRVAVSSRFLVRKLEIDPSSSTFNDLERFLNDSSCTLEVQKVRAVVMNKLDDGRGNVDMENRCVGKKNTKGIHQLLCM